LALATIVASLLLVLDGSPWWRGTVALAASAVLVLGLVLRTRQRFGGITGDVLGAGIELSLAALLVVASAG
jgi:adenosylcobinamide-GDP ribazoletransferase